QNVVTILNPPSRRVCFPALQCSVGDKVVILQHGAVRTHTQGASVLVRAYGQPHREGYVNFADIGLPIPHSKTRQVWKKLGHPVLMKE
ncbi:unnamed protein product, partial [Vitrella brassicaformis CCMP3155]